MTKSLHEIEAHDISLLTLLSNGYILKKFQGSSKYGTPNGSSTSKSALINCISKLIITYI
jgi:hypothetical protein